MAGSDQPSSPAAGGSPHSGNTRLGLSLFAVYLVLYGAFVFLNAFAPALMAEPLLAGINAAVLSGLGLILAALALAVLYGWLCRALPGRDTEAPR